MASLIEDLKRSLMSPDEDFVRIGETDEGMATRKVADREMEEIKRQAKKKSNVGEEIRLKKNTAQNTVKSAPKKKKPPVYQEEFEEEEEDEEEYGNESRMEKVTTILAVVGAVIIGCFVIFLVGRTVGIFDLAQESQQITMIGVEGLSEADAVARLTQLGLKPEVIYDQSDTVEKGLVIAADVKEGAIVSGGSKVILTVSGEQPQEDQQGIPVPEVMGFLEADATATLKKSGFEVEKSDGYSDTVEKGKVMSQDPAGGKAQPNSKVVIVISQGPDPGNKVTMPDILGMAPEDAIAILVEHGLNPGQQTDMNDDNPDLIGKVCYASHTVGAQVEPGTTIDIGISIGPKAATYMFQEAIGSPADLDPEYKEGTECTVTITGQSGVEYSKTTVRTFPITTINLHGLSDPAALITYEYYVEAPATTTTNENGETVTVPGAKTMKTTQRQVLFTPEG